MTNPLNALIPTRDDQEPATDFRWATVTGTSPLAVRIDTEDDPLPGVPSTIVSGLVANDRVLVLIHRRRATVLGKAGG